MNKTNIEWVKNPDGTQGYTWSPITGCLNHKEGMCLGGNFPCYAYRLANGRLCHHYLFNPNVAGYDVDKLTGKQKIEMLENPFYPRFWESRLLDIPIKNYEPNKHLGIFCCDMSDLFGIGVPEEWTRRVLTKIRTGGAWHRFYLLTKQPQNLAKFSPFPDNCWVGVTATGQESYYDAISNLAGIEAKVKYISFEPLLEQINGGECAEEVRLGSIDECDWVIIGSQTKPYKPPEIEWVGEIVSACDQAKIPVFLKNNLKQIIYDTQAFDLCTKVVHGESEFDGLELTLRQEMPK
jgi:protein gp37